jgi:mannose-binding lectin 2
MLGNTILNLILLIIYTNINLTLQDQWNTKDFFRREHSLSKPYGGTSGGIPFWDFIGSTVVSNKYIRLTADQQSLKGALWNSIVSNSKPHNLFQTQSISTLIIE